MQSICEKSIFINGSIMLSHLLASTTSHADINDIWHLSRQHLWTRLSLGWVNNFSIQQQLFSMNENVIDENGLTEDPAVKIASRFFLRLSYRIAQYCEWSATIHPIWMIAIWSKRITISSDEIFSKWKNKLIVRWSGHASN